MSKKDSEEAQHCILKINCSCKGCEKKVKKLLLKIQGVDDVNIDAEEGKALVVGNVDPNELITMLKKSGKHAEICVIHKPKVDEPSKKKSNSKNGSKEHGNEGNDNVAPSHNQNKGNNGNKNMGQMVTMDPMMMNNGGGYHHHHPMMQMPPSYGQQRFMAMAIMNQQNMFPPMYGMPHPSMMHGMPHPSMMHGMPHPSMMPSHHPIMDHRGSKPSNVKVSKKKTNQFKEM